ncbi:hypothetical protein ACFQX7_09695 [Luedemannella flava]
MTAVGQPVVPAVTRYVYDGAERQTAQILVALGLEKWRTTTAYAGERTSVTPPAGGTATTTVTDARGRVTELRQYHAAGNVGSDTASTFDRTRYTYTVGGSLDTVTDPVGNVWSHTYDQWGRETTSVDPDAGTTIRTYDKVGQLVTTKTGDTTLAFTYDKLGRKTTVRDGSTTGAKRTEWFYDKKPDGTALANAIGRTTGVVRYSGSATVYSAATTSFDVAGQPLTDQLVIPDAETGLAGTYTTSYTYRADGQLASKTLPAVGDLTSEKIVYGYNDVGLPLYSTSGLTSYVYDSVYDKLGQLTQLALGAYGSRVFVNYGIDEPTRRLTGTTVSLENKPTPAKYAYTYDPAGNLTKVTDSPYQQAVDTQCYRYDHLARMTEAWTAGSGDCAAAPSVAGLGQSAPYWHSYTFDETGNRTKEVQHGATDITRTYTYPAAKADQPHTLTSVTSGSATVAEFDYDTRGNTTKRTVGGTVQTLTWDAEGHLAELKEGTTSTTYTYDVDGNRLIRNDGTGKTLYLPDGSELRYTKSTGAKKGTRHYEDSRGETIAVRTGAGLHWVVGDHHGTAEVTVASGDLTASRRRTLPFGAVRAPPRPPGRPRWTRASSVARWTRPASPTSEPGSTTRRSAGSSPPTRSSTSTTRSR